MALNVTKDVSAMQRMTVKELRRKFAEVFGDETRSGNKAWLIKRIAWRMQAVLFATTFGTFPREYSPLSL